VGGRTVVRQDGGARVARRTGRCMEASTRRKKPLSTGSHVRKMKTSTGRTEEEAESRAEEEEVAGLRAPPVRTGWYCLHRGFMFFFLDSAIFS
jgi:hypothetical protein